MPGFCLVHTEDGCGYQQNKTRQLALLFMVLFEFLPMPRRCCDFPDWVIDKARSMTSMRKNHTICWSRKNWIYEALLRSCHCRRFGFTPP